MRNVFCQYISNVSMRLDISFTDIYIMNSITGLLFLFHTDLTDV